MPCSHPHPYPHPIPIPTRFPVPIPGCSAGTSTAPWARAHPELAPPRLLHAVIPPSAGASKGQRGGCSPAYFQLQSPWQAIFSSSILLLLPSVKLRMSNVILNEQWDSEKKMPARYLINGSWNLRGRPKMLQTLQEDNKPKRAVLGLLFL